jgi:hypothetical protein
MNKTSLTGRTMRLVAITAIALPLGLTACDGNPCDQS